MKYGSYIFVALVALLFTSCNSEPTLQKYFVEHSKEKNFSTFDIAPSIIQLNNLQLSENEKKALASLHKFNILLYSKDSLNANKLTEESKNVKALLKSDNYDELIKFNSGDMGASINTLGAGEHIDEFVVFAYNKNTGFGVIRVLGDDMTPQNVFTIAQLLQKSSLDTQQLQPLQYLIPAKN